MDLTSHYCPDRRDLETVLWARVSDLSSQSGQLLKLVGEDHEAFVTAKTECRRTTAEIVELRQKLEDHRLSHGC